MTILEEIKAGRLVVVPPVSVKPLEWDDAGFAASASVQAFGLTYALQNGRDGWFAAVVGRGISEYLKAEIADLDAAKAAAQADYEARVLSALAASPDHTTGLVALVEGMERERDEARATCNDSLHVPRAPNTGRYLAETNDGRLLYLNHADEWQECPNFISRALAAEAKVEALREALAEAIEFADQDAQALTASGIALVERWRRALTQEQNNG